jgi:hypothetical protein
MRSSCTSSERCIRDPSLVTPVVPGMCSGPHVLFLYVLFPYIITLLLMSSRDTISTHEFTVSHTWHNKYCDGAFFNCHGIKITMRGQRLTQVY